IIRKQIVVPGRTDGILLKRKEGETRTVRDDRTAADGNQHVVVPSRIGNVHHHHEPAAGETVVADVWIGRGLSRDRAEKIVGGRVETSENAAFVKDFDASVEANKNLTGADRGLRVGWNKTGLRNL